jgi:hypothetical protein
MITEYLYTIPGGWQPMATPRLPVSAPTVGDALYALGYRWLAESARSDYNVGHFFVWQYLTRDPAWPRYVAHCTQWGDEAVVWIADLPTVWEWIRLYGSVSFVLQRQQCDEDDEDDGDEDDDEEADTGPRCPDCGAPMTLYQAVPLAVLLGKEATEFDV